MKVFEMLDGLNAIVGWAEGVEAEQLADFHRLVREIKVSMAHGRGRDVEDALESLEDLALSTFGFPEGLKAKLSEIMEEV